MNPEKLTAERLVEIKERASVLEQFPGVKSSDRQELFSHIAALTADIAELKADKGRLETLFRISDTEGSNGKWMVVLEYNNYQDVALVRDADLRIVGQNNDLDIGPIEQFRRAIDNAAIIQTKEGQ